MKIGIIVGRFQTPILHAGHLTLIGTAIQECDIVRIFLGCLEDELVIDNRNPYSYGTRYAMIHKVFPQIGCGYIADCKSNEEWNKKLDTMISHIEGKDEVTLYHSRDSFKESYIGKYQLREIPEIEGYSATNIREQYNNKYNEDIKLSK